MEILTRAAGELGIEFGSERQALFQRYFDLLEEGARTANLTGARGWPRVRDELFLRSLRLIPMLRERLPGTGRGSILDVGAGAGVPGLVLKLALPEPHLTLLDSTRKKTDFLTRVVSDLRLTDVEVVRARAEAAAREAQHRGRYDVVVARSVARLPELAELTLPFCSVGGAVIAAKHQDVADEVREAAWAAEQLGGAPAEVRVVAAPGPSPPDAIVVWRKVRATPERYPRRAGVPHKRPLLAPRRNDEPGA